MASQLTKLYYNTGFNLNNIPDNSSILSSLSKIKTVDSIWILQDYIGSIKIRITWDDVKDVDYCSIGNTFYFVTNITMSNENTAILQLQIDPITTVGLDNIDFINGWCTRRHVANDELFSNNLAEDFTPLDTLKVSFAYLDHLKGKDTTKLSLISSTIDLSQTFNVAKTFVDEQSKLSVSVPHIGGVNSETTCYLTYRGGLKSKILPSTLLYNINANATTKENTKNALSSVWSLGLTDAITSSYSIEWPSANISLVYNNATDSTTEYGDIEFIGITPADIELPEDFNFTWSIVDYTIKNNKVFTRQFNSYIMTSISTGATIEYTPDSIYSVDSVYPEFLVIGDPAPDGCTYLVPKYYYKTELQSTYPLYGGLKGGTWVNNQLTFSGREGGLVSAATTAFQLQQHRLNRVGTFFNGLEDVLTLPLKVGGSSFTSTPQDPPLDTNNFWQVSDRLLALNNYPGYGAKEYMKDYPASSGFPAVNMSGLANSLYTNPQKARLAQDQLLLGEQINQNLNAPKIYFPFGSNLNTYFGNGFYGIRCRLSDNDTIRFDRYLTAFGYATNEPFEISALNCRANFNYVKVSDLNIKFKTDENYGIRTKALIVSMFNNGIRIWHELPNSSAFINNPIKQ